MGKALGEKERLRILENIAHKDEVLFKGMLTFACTTATFKNNNAIIVVQVMYWTESRALYPLYKR